MVVPPRDDQQAAIRLGPRRLLPVVEVLGGGAIRIVGQDPASALVKAGASTYGSRLPATFDLIAGQAVHGPDCVGVPGLDGGNVFIGQWAEHDPRASDLNLAAPHGLRSRQPIAPRGRLRPQACTSRRWNTQKAMARNARQYRARTSAATPGSGSSDAGGRSLGAKAL